MTTTFRTILTALTTIALALAHPAFAQTNEDETLDAFFKSYLEKHFQQQPLDATALGDHRFDSQLDDISAKARAGWKSLTRETLRQLPREVEFKKLSRDGQIDFQIFKHHLQTQIWLTENTQPFEEDPRTYGGYINDGVYLLLTQSTLPRETNISNCVARMAEIPRIIATARATLTHPPKSILETAIRQNRGAIGFYETELFQLAGDTPQLDRLKVAASKVVTELKQYQNFLEGELMTRADGDWRLGKKKFAQKFALVTDAGITAEQNLADAKAEFDSVRRDMYLVSRQLWCKYFPNKVFPPDTAIGRRETITRVVEAVDREHGKPEDLVRDARATVERIKAFIREKNYLQLPDPDLCEVIEMPEFRRGNSLAYLENAPPLDPAAHSYFAVSPPPADWSARQIESFLEEYNQHMLQILAIHEGYPGHYVQLEYSNRSSSLIRRVLQSGAFIEGWAVYGEQSMLNEGYGGGDLRLRLMQLKFYLRAVGNAILDYKMHCAKMTDAEAMRFMTEEAFQSEGEAKLKLIRAKQSSVQLSTYFVGRMAHYRLRQQIETELSDKFELARYHAAVMEQGSVPLKFLPVLVRARLGLLPSINSDNSSAGRDFGSIIVPAAAF